MKKYLIVFIFVFIFTLVVSMGRANNKEITGLVRLVGNHPFPQLAIYSEYDKRNYIFDKIFFDEYKQYENKVITIRAVVKKQVLTLADKSAKITFYNIVDSSVIRK